MKFILNESAKFILNERFTLLEATMADVAKSWAEKAKIGLPTVKELLQKMIDNAKPSSRESSAGDYDRLLKDLSDKGKAVNISRQLPGITDELKTDLKAYQETIKKVFDSINKKYPDVDGTEQFVNEFNEFQKLISTDPWTDDTKNKALSIFDSLFKLIDIIANTQIKAIMAKGNTDEKINELKANCEDAIKKADKISENGLNLNFSTLSNEDLIKYVKLIQEKIIPVIDKIQTAKITGPLRTIQVDRYNEFVSVVNRYFDEFIAFTPVKLNNEKAKFDWGKVYEGIDTPEKKEAFWVGNPVLEQPFKDGYFKIEWGEDAKKIADLGLALINTLMHPELGWDAISNPFIYFLKMHLAWVQNGLINKRTFVHIYNAVARDELTGNDLRGNGIFKKYNIIFNERLFADVNSMDDYLKLQYKIKNGYYNLPGDKQKAFRDNPGKVLANFMYVEGNTETLDADIPVGAGEFRPVHVISGLIDQLMHSNEKIQKPNVTTRDIDIMVNALDKNEALKILSFLTIFWAVDHSRQLNEVDTAFDGQLYRISDKVHVDHRDVSKYINDSILKLNQMEYDPKSVVDLLTKLMIKAGYEKKKK